jgi:hypothetical protein
LVLIGIHGDPDWKKGVSAAKQHKVSYPVGQTNGQATLKAYKITGFPTLFVIDRKGIIRSVRPNNLDQAIKSALSAK